MATFNMDPRPMPLSPPLAPPQPTVMRVEIVGIRLTLDQIFPVVWKVIFSVIILALLPVAALVAIFLVLAGLAG